MNRILFGLAIACLAATAPIKATPSGRLAANAACAQTEEMNGTCCREERSLCVVDGLVFQNYYYKESGTCTVHG
ncbi:MAG TPA: hypothetical protein VF541_19380 [Longimicrobium sp.]